MSFFFYLKSRELNFLGEDLSTFLFNKKKISNKLFFLKLFALEQKKLNVSISETEKKFDYFIRMIMKWIVALQDEKKIYNCK